MHIIADKVHEALKDSLYRDDEITDRDIPSDAVRVEGILNSFAFNPARLEAHRTEVAGWLASLPRSFRENEGGGMSFLNACYDDTDQHWGEHRSMDALFVLGCGLGLAKCVLPREMWKVFPGGMPYYSIKVTE